MNDANAYRGSAIPLVVSAVLFLVGACSPKQDTETVIEAEPIVESEDITKDTDAVAELNDIISRLEALQPDTEELAELRDIVSEFESTSIQVAAIESGVQLRGPALTAPQINERIVVQGSRTRSLQQRIRTRMLERQEAQEDESVESSKAAYDEAREQYRRAVQILQKHSERQSQVIRKIG